jgi:phosphoribosyl 1,2-cyclic phosphodiesterase
MIDCGADWLNAVNSVSPTAIVLTHAHGDHAYGLAKGVSCPVYATDETWSVISRFPIAERRSLTPYEPFISGGVRFEAFPVDHSIRAPAVGYRVTADDTVFFYVPDVAAIGHRREALGGIELYIGDGATITQSMIRRRDHMLIGHSPIAAQLDWCEAEGVTRAIFTHCGSGIVKQNPRLIEACVKELGVKHNIDAGVAYDGLNLRLARPKPRD